MGGQEAGGPTYLSLCSYQSHAHARLQSASPLDIKYQIIFHSDLSLTRSIWYLWVQLITLPSSPTVHLSSSSSQTPHLLNSSFNPTLVSNVGVNVLYSDIIYSAVHTNDLFINTLSSLISAWASINLVREHLHLLGRVCNPGFAYFCFALHTCTEGDSDEITRACLNGRESSL